MSFNSKSIVHFSGFVTLGNNTKKAVIFAMPTNILPMFSLRILPLCLCLFIASCASPNAQLPHLPEPIVSPVKAVKKLRIGLALGGGAARGFAHIGVIKALEAQGIFPEIVVGTSAGSMVGALYAAGNNGYALHKLALAMDEAAISDWTVPLFSKASGVLKGDALQNYVNKEVANVPLEKLKISFGVVATDLNSGHAVLFRRGNTGVAVRASSAVPSLFQPVKVGGRMYVDGGLVSPVPVRFTRDMGADFVIAVNISVQPEGQAAINSIDVLLQTFAIMGQSINSFELKEADIVITPNLASMRGNDFNGRNIAILAGEQAATEAMAEIKQKLNANRRQ